MGNHSITFEAKADEDFEMQARFVDNLVDAYWARCSQDISMPTAITREVHRHLENIKKFIDRSSGEQAAMSEDMQTMSEDFQSHVSYLKTSMLDLKKPCSSARVTAEELEDESQFSSGHPRSNAF